MAAFHRTPYAHPAARSFICTAEIARSECDKETRTNSNTVCGISIRVCDSEYIHVGGSASLLYLVPSSRLKKASLIPLRCDRTAPRYPLTTTSSRTSNGACERSQAATAAHSRPASANSPAHRRGKHGARALAVYIGTGAIAARCQLWAAPVASRHGPAVACFVREALRAHAARE